jgi:hypothetical protein
MKSWKNSEYQSIYVLILNGNALSWKNSKQESTIDSIIE